MAKRGRPRHPDILTPREWEVLSLLREGLSNEQIAERLDITERTAKFHVSEILSKLGVSTRQEAASWWPEERGTWWAIAGAPIAFARRLPLRWAPAALVATVVIAVAVGVGVLVWGLARTDGADADRATVAQPGAEPLVWEAGYRSMHIEAVPLADCGDPETGQQYGVPMLLDLREESMNPRGRNLLGLEGIAYQYVPEQVNALEFNVAPEGWEMSARVDASAGASPNRFATGELFLRRLDRPDMLFRYEQGFCNQTDGSPREPPDPWGPTTVASVPDDPPEVSVQPGVAGPSFEDVRDIVSSRYGPNMRLLTAEQQPSGDWVVQLAGNGMGPAPPGHMYGLELTIYAAGEMQSSETCCIDFVAAQ